MVLSAEQFVARAQRRGRRAMHVLIAAALGLLAGTSIAFIAGSRRSSSVVERFFATVPRFDLRVFSPSPTFTPDAVAALPGVEAVQNSTYMGFVMRGRDPEASGINTFPADFSTRSRSVRVLRGRLPDGSNPFEVVVNEAFTEQFGLDVGDTIPAQAFAADQRDDLEHGIYTARGPSYDFVLTGVVRVPDDIALDITKSPRAGFTSQDTGMVVPVQFWDQHHGEFIDFGTAFEIRLVEGASADEFSAAASELAGGADEVLSEPWTVSDRQAAFAAPVQLETSALLAVGVGTALGGLVLAILLMRLEQRDLDKEQPVMRALGMTTLGFSRVAVRRTAPLAMGAAVVGVAAAIVLSARFPIGLGHQLELDRGIDVNVVAVVLGAMCIVAALLSTAALMARRGPTRVASRTRSSRSIVTGRLPLHSALGARLAGGGPGPRGRSAAVAGVVVATMATTVVVAVSTWLAGANRLYGEPAARGWMWDIAVGNVNFALDPATAGSVSHNPLVAASTLTQYGQATLNGQSVEIFAFDLAGSAPPQVIAGRLPRSPSEAALGSGLLRRLGLHLGDTATLDLSSSEFIDEEHAGAQVTLTIVGESVAPVFGESDLADIGVVPLQTLVAAGANGSGSIVLADVIGPDEARNVRTIADEYTEEVHTDVIPSRVVNMWRVRLLPIVGMVLAGATALLALAATVFAAGRSGRHSLAVLAALGLGPRERRRIVAWQGVITAAAVVAAGVPLGMLAGARWWRGVAHGLGVRAVPTFMPWLIGVVIVAAVAVAVVVAFTAVRRTRRASLGQLLRAE